MTVIAFRSGSLPDLPVDLEVPPLDLSDEALFELCRRNHPLRIERNARGDLEIMTPVGGASSRRNALLVHALVAWASADGTGVAFDSSAGFLLPDGSMRSPDAAWVRRSRLAALADDQKERFLPLAPDFVAEIRSPSDPLPALEAKLEAFVANGVRLGWLIDPERRRLHVYRPGAEPIVHQEPETAAGDPELPGLALDLAPLWESL